MSGITSSVACGDSFPSRGSQKKDEHWRNLADRLPLQAGAELTKIVGEDVYDNECLGESYLLIKRVSMEITPELKRTMTPADWAEREKKTRRVWGAECKCTSCGQRFLTRWQKSGGVTFIHGDDGLFYEDPTGEGMEFQPGETFLCPWCYKSVEIRLWAVARSGRTWQVLQPELVRVDGYDVMIFWLVTRTLYPDGDDMLEITPRQALAVDKAGKLRRFTTEHGAWRPCKTVRDPEQITYYSHEAANGRKVGGWGMEFGPEKLTGTGEKTGLEIYMQSGGTWPGRYLLLWRKHPQVENLMRQGFARAITDAVDRPMDNVSYWQDLQEVPVIPWVDWNEKAPYKMLHMSREAFRVIRTERWSRKETSVWRRCADTLPDADAMAYNEWRLQVGTEGVEKLLNMVQAGWTELTPGKALRYLKKQKLGREGVDLLTDYRKMLRAVGAAETEETVWPRRLMDAHDRYAAVLAAQGTRVTDAAFLTVKAMYKGLEWTDGELCVLLPLSELDLKREGDVLRHCVGGYGEDHVNGKLIFFVRKYRRPERCYYTLNIDMNGKLPRKIQLHGYGNEHHGKHKEHTHKIPKKVRDFVDRWEREVLMPWWAENRAAKKPNKKNRRKTA